MYLPTRRSTGPSPTASAGLAGLDSFDKYDPRVVVLPRDVNER
jgi:hypothetical protein